MIVATIGRYAIPDFSGLYPHVLQNMPNSAVPMHRLIRLLRFRDRHHPWCTSADADRA